MSNRIRSTIAACCLLLTSVACEGHIDGDTRADGLPAGGSSAAGGGGPGGGSGAGAARCESATAAAALPARLRRLTSAEYDRTLRALVSETELPPYEFPPDAALGTFHSAAALLRVTDLLAGELAKVAQTLSTSVSRQALGVAGCEPGNGDEAACASAFVTSFAGRAYRRPLTPLELTRLLQVYEQGRRDADFLAGVALVVEAVLQSPHLLYRTELGSAGDAGEKVALTPFELASQLSYLITLGPPDAELSRAASAGTLLDSNEREAQARRLLLLPGAHSAMSKFAGEWLDIEKLPSLSKDAQMFPDFSATVGRAWQLDTEQRFAATLLAGDGSLRSLLQGGLLTERSVLAAHAGVQWSSPTHRGKMIRTQLLCQPVPPPPPGLLVTIPPATPGATTRQRISTHASDPSCAACHAQMDPLGFAFEHYDALGQYRETDNGSAIDSSGQISGGTDADGAFDGAEALASRLSNSSDVRGCFARQWLTFALGDRVNDALSCALADELETFAAEQLSLPELLVRVVRSETFAQRSASTP